MIKFARALQLGTAEAEQILRHFHADLLSPDGGDLTALPYAARRDALVAPRPGREHVKVPTNWRSARLARSLDQVSRWL